MICTLVSAVCFLISSPPYLLCFSHMAFLFSEQASMLLLFRISFLVITSACILCLMASFSGMRSIFTASSIASSDLNLFLSLSLIFASVTSPSLTLTIQPPSYEDPCIYLELLGEGHNSFYNKHSDFLLAQCLKMDHKENSHAGGGEVILPVSLTFLQVLQSKALTTLCSGLHFEECLPRKQLIS